jgi:hypothetical protein
MTSELAERLVREEEEIVSPNNVSSVQLFKDVNGRNILLIGEIHEWDSKAAEILTHTMDQILGLALEVPVCVDIFYEYDYIYMASRVWGSDAYAHTKESSIFLLYQHLLQLTRRPGLGDIIRLHRVDLRNEYLQEMTRRDSLPFPKEHIPVLGFLALNARWGEMIHTKHNTFRDPESKPTVSELHLAGLYHELWKSVHPASEVTVEDVLAAQDAVPLLQKDWIATLNLMRFIVKNYKKITATKETAKEATLRAINDLFDHFLHAVEVGFAELTYSNAAMFVMDYYTVFRMLVKDFSGKVERSPRVCTDDPPKFVIFYGGSKHTHTISHMIASMTNRQPDQSELSRELVLDFLNIRPKLECKYELRKRLIEFALGTKHRENGNRTVRSLHGIITAALREAADPETFLRSIRDRIVSDFTLPPFQINDLWLLAAALVSVISPASIDPAVSQIYKRRLVGLQRTFEDPTSSEELRALDAPITEELIGKLICSVPGK